MIMLQTETERRAATELRVKRPAASWSATPRFSEPVRICLGMFTEEVAPGAFTRSLAANADVGGLVDHDPSMLLARTSSGTLRLAEDARGLLSFDIGPPRHPARAYDMLALAERGDIGGASFSSSATDELWHRDHRTLRDVVP